MPSTLYCSLMRTTKLFVYLLFTISCTHCGGDNSPSSELRIFSRQDFLRVNEDMSISNEIHERRKRQTDSDLNYLIKYGYVSNGALKSNGEVQEQRSVTRAILELQRFMGLPQTGIFDEATRSMMRKPRCANPDRDSVMGDLVRKKRFTTVGSKWKNLRITYSINNFTPKIGKTATHNAIDDAFRVWASYAPLEFNKVTKDDNPDIVILFATGNHDDNTPFDGEGGYLAHAFYPGPGIGGDTHFDAEEPWTVNKGPYEGNDLFLVAVHELGHALGLGHSPDTKAIMAPVYKYHDTTNFRLPQDDIDGIQMLYGVSHRPPNIPIRPTSTRTKATTTTTTMTTTTKKASKSTTTLTRKPYRPYTREPTKRTPSTRLPATPPPPDVCSLSNYDAVAFLRNELYVFSSQYLWRKGPKDESPRGPFPIASFWSRLSSGVDAAFEKPATGVIVLIKGSYYYEFDGMELQRGFPKHVRSMGINGADFDAAIWWERNGRMYFFKDNKYWRIHKGASEKDYPKDIGVWTGIPGNLDAAFTGVGDDGLNHTYFVKGEQYWTFHNRRVAAVGEPGNFAIDWLGCPSTTPSLPRPPNTGVSVPAIAAVSVVIVMLLVGLTFYLVHQKKQGFKYPPTDVGVVSSPYRAGYKTHHAMEDNDIHGRRLWVKTFHHGWNNIKFSFQQRV